MEVEGVDTCSPGAGLQGKGNGLKGGTFLIKCYQILERFSEDVDIFYAASEDVPNESSKW